MPSPFIQGMYAFNDQGQGGQISGPTGMSGFLPAAWGAQNWADQDLADRTQGLVDPRTGQLTRQPRTPAEMAAAQSQLEKWANTQQTNNYNQAMGMLTGSFGGSPGSVNGSYVPGSEDLGMSGGSRSPYNYAAPIGGTAKTGFTPNAGDILRAPLGSGPQGMSAPGVSMTRDGRTGQLINNSTGELMSQPPPGFGGAGPGSGPQGFTNQMGAGGQTQFTSGAGGGYSTGTVGGGMAMNQNLHDMFTGRMQDMLQNPGLSDATVNKMIGRGNDQLAQSESDASMNLIDRANANGGGAGAIQGGLQQLASNYAGQKADNQRQITTQAEQDRENRQQQAMGTAGEYLGRVQDREAADALRQTQMARDDRNQEMQMLLSRQYSVPSLSGGGQQFGVNFGVGGGANAGGQTGSISGGMQMGAFGPGQGGTTPSGFGGSASSQQTPAASSARWGAPAQQFNSGVLGMSSKSGGGANGGDGPGAMMDAPLKAGAANQYTRNRFAAKPAFA